MSAPLTEPISSVSSSGHVDGLGRRALAFDRETGAMLDRLYLRPELAVFEQLLRRRVEHLSTLEEERFARPSAVERDDATGELVVVAEFIPGSRLSELLEVSANAAVVPGVDVALGYLLEALPALAVLHTGKRLVHGLIDPSRTILTEEGQVVFLDAAVGPAVECLRLSPQRLWAEFGISSSADTKRVTFDPVGDVSQAGLSALMLVLGRNLQPHEYPDALSNLLMEVIEVAQIRGTTNFATGLQQFLQRALPIPGRRPFASTDEALSEVRQLVRREIGLDVCRQAVIDFVALMDATFAANADRDEPRAAADANGAHVPELDQFLDTFETVSTTDDAFSTRAPEDSPDEDDDDDELEISLDQLESGAPQAERSSVEEVYDLPSLEDSGSLSSEFESFRDYDAPAEPDPAVPPASDPQPVSADAFQAASVEEVWTEPAVSSAPLQSDLDAFVAAPEVEPVAMPATESPAFDPDVTAAPAAEAPPESAPQAGEEQEQEKEPGSARRRKRQQQKSARARKDKLRSSNADQKVPPVPPPPAPPPPAPKPASPSGWLVSPHRAAAESLIPDALQPPPPPPRPAPMAMPSFAPTPVGQVPQPTYASPSVPAYGTPSVVKPAPPPPPPVVQPVSSGQVKLKDEPFQPNAPRKHFEPEPASSYGSDRFTTLSLGRSDSTEETGRTFPWRLAAIAIAVATVAILMGRTYLPGRTAVVGEPGAETETAQEAPATPPPPKPDSPIPAGKGRINIQTQPAGLRVLLDRKLVGETPLQVDAAPGRRVLTFMTSGGEVMHSVRVVAGKTVNLDIPVFSGWVSVIAPIVLNISEDGRSMGTTEQNRLMLPPGRHRLTLSNPDFGYNAVHEVDVEPGAVRSITVDAKGTVNLNAQPWAEVWLDGAKLGETPLAGAPVPLGLREFVFKHPQFGERRVSATVRANMPAVVAVDFTK